MNIFLVRHGETEWNSLGRFQGQVDVNLNPTGLAQSLDIAKASFTWNLSAIYTSPLIRTTQIADEIGRQIGLPVIADSRLMELSLGELEGITGQDMRNNWAEVYANWRTDPGYTTLPGGESLSELQERGWDFFLEKEMQHQNDPAILFVSHNFTIRCIISHLLGIPWSHFHMTHLDLGSVSIIETDGNTRKLKGYNSTSHLSNQNRSETRG